MRREQSCLIDFEASYPPSIVNVHRCGGLTVPLLPHQTPAIQSYVLVASSLFLPIRLPCRRTPSRVPSKHWDSVRVVTAVLAIHATGIAILAGYQCGGYEVWCRSFFANNSQGRSTARMQGRLLSGLIIFMTSILMGCGGRKQCSAAGGGWRACGVTLQVRFRQSNRGDEKRPGGHSYRR